jgi:hypothetical protein
VAPSSSIINNYELLETSRVTASGNTFATSNDTATAIDTVTDSETKIATATEGFMRKP